MSIRATIGFICVLCTLVNTVLFICEPKKPMPLSFLTANDVESLRRPSQYIGFENISRPFPPIPRHFENFPILLTQVDSQHPSKVFPEDLEAYLSPVGTISPEYKQVLLTDTVATIAQFRAVDFGMEICEIHLDLGPLILPSSVIIDVYQLEKTAPFDSNRLSHRSRPQRSQKLAEVTGAQWRHNTTCALEELLSFELACSSGCNLQWVQSPKTYKGPSFYMVQHSTK